MDSVAITLLTIALIVQALVLIAALSTIRRRIVELNGLTEPSIIEFLTSHDADPIVHINRQNLAFCAGAYDLDARGALYLAAVIRGNRSS